MPLRILSGLIGIRKAVSGGQVTIGFNPHVLVSGPDDATVTERRQIGPAGRFTTVPTKLIALRQTFL